MIKSMSILACAAIAAGISVAAAARGAGGGGMGHASAALENSNGRFSQDRDKGLDRAEDRRSTQGAKHGKATGEAKRKKPRPAQHASGSKDN